MLRSEQVTGIKSQSDGKPACFREPEHTNIPQLCQHVKQVTRLRREAASKALVGSASDLLNGVMLYVGDAGNSSQFMSEQGEALFNTEVLSLTNTIQGHAAAIVKTMDQRVAFSLKPAVRRSLEVACSCNSFLRSMLASQRQGSPGSQLSSRGAAKSGDPNKKRTAAGCITAHTMQLCDDRECMSLGVPVRSTLTKNSQIRYQPTLQCGVSGCGHQVESDMMVVWDRTMNAMLTEQIVQCSGHVQQACSAANARIATELCQ